MTATPAFAAKLRTPFAVLGVCTDGRAITRVTYLPRDERAQAPTDEVADRVARELEAYLADPEFRFTVPLALAGTPFQRRVWRALRAIPAGTTVSYQTLARRIRGSEGDAGSRGGERRESGADRAAMPSRHRRRRLTHRVRRRTRGQALAPPARRIGLAVALSSGVCQPR